MHDLVNTEFETRLYKHASNAFPGLTVRRFSKMLGKSSGYWSSVQAQDIPVSNHALTHLIEYIETRIILTGQQSHRQHLLNLKKLVGEELIFRFRRLSGLEFPELASAAEVLTPMPFVLQSY
jgi:hypothetical protein